MIEINIKTKKPFCVGFKNEWYERSYILVKDRTDLREVTKVMREHGLVFSVEKGPHYYSIYPKRDVIAYSDNNGSKKSSIVFN